MRYSGPDENAVTANGIPAGRRAKVDGAFGESLLKVAVFCSQGPNIP